MTVIFLVFCAMMSCFLITDYPNFREKFLLPSSGKKTEASTVSGTFRNFYMAARCDTPEGSKLLFYDFWATVNFSEVYLICSN